MDYIQPLGGNPNDPYIDGDPATGTPGSIVPAAALEDPQREIINAITAAGLTPDSADLTQLTQAIQALGGGGSSAGLGVGQTWQDVTASRAFGVVYTNTTNKPIAVSFKGVGSTLGWSFDFYVNGIKVGIAGVHTNNVSHSNGFFIVPPGSTYKIMLNNISAFDVLWLELR